MFIRLSIQINLNSHLIINVFYIYLILNLDELAMKRNSKTPYHIERNINSIYCIDAEVIYLKKIN